MLDAIVFIVGFFLGVVIFYSGVFFLYRTIDEKRRKVEEKESEENEFFLRILSRKGSPGETIQIGNNSASYDEDGDLCWDSVRGCVGKSTFFK